MNWNLILRGFTGMIFILGGCDLINPEEPVPAYLEVQAPVLSTIDSSEGTSSHRITDAWVYVEGDFIGVYEYPSVFPVISDGETELILIPGIIDNGISSTRAEYPFYTAVDTTLFLEPPAEYTVKGYIRYKERTVFAFREDFEETSLALEVPAGDTTIRITRDPEEVFEGSGSGVLHLKEGDDFVELTSFGDLPLPRGESVYAELNYRCNVAFNIGLRYKIDGVEFDYFKLKVNAKEFWNKLYVNFENDIDKLRADSYKLFIRMEKPDSVDQARLLLDNLKILHF